MEEGGEFAANPPDLGVAGEPPVVGDDLWEPTTVVYVCLSDSFVLLSVKSCIHAIC